MIYFTADNHFCHGNIIGSCYRPFKNVDDMNRAMIENWNSYITDYDEVYILGDFLYKGRGREANDILSRLKGKKYLIKGNHDKYLDDPQFNIGAFQWVKDYYVLKLEDGRMIVMFHYPMLSWYGSHHGSIHLYGHVHNSEVKGPEFGEKIKLLGSNAINVGVDINDFYPVSLKRILELVKEGKDENLRD
jgi:calcineurin-like phosphoesterase family protein